MKGFLLSCCVGTTLVSGLAIVLPGRAAEATTAAAQPEVCPANPAATNFDVIVFGDEVPGVMTALKVQRELQEFGHGTRRGTRVALITEGNIEKGIGGHVVRGGLAYLDRNQVPPNLRSQYGTFGRPSQLYQEFLQLGRVNTIALDRYVAAPNLSQALSRAGVEVVGNVSLDSVQTAGDRLCAFTASGRTYSAQTFVDASQSGELAAASGVAMMRGLEALGFPDSALSLGLMIDLYGVDINQLKRVEAELINRFFNPQDTSAQQWLEAASGGDPARRQELLRGLLDERRQPKLLYQGTPDSADVRSLALSILVHGYLGKPYDLKSSGFLFDRANIAILPDRLSLNALLFYTDAQTALQLSTSGAKPTADMLAVANEIKTLFEKMGVSRVEIMDELYIRNAGQLANPVDELSATLMTAGGVPASDALGTFGYHLDDRGGIEGLDEEVQESFLRLLNFEQMPVFNYGFRHTLPQERENLAVLGPASGFGGLGTTAGRIVEFNVSVGEGLAIAIAKSIREHRPLQSITNAEVHRAMGYSPAIYGYQTGSYGAISTLERRFRSFNFGQTYLNRAKSLFDQGNYTEASHELSRLIAVEPRNAEAYFLRGNTALTLQSFEQAAADYSQAIRLEASLTDAYIYRGYLYALSQNYAQAMADFEQALQQTPSSAEAEFGQDLARALQRGGLRSAESTAAVSWLDEAIQRQPEFAAAYVARGIAQANAGNPEQAKADFEQAIALYRARGSRFAMGVTTNPPVPLR